MKKMLIVDDEAVVLSLLIRALREWDVEVLTSTNLEDAEYAIKNTHFDVVLSDIRLTGMLDRTGLELISYVKEKSPGSYVIIMTAYGTPDIEKEAYAKGAYFYFEKPIPLENLFDRLAALGMRKKSAAKGVRASEA